MLFLCVVVGGGVVYVAISAAKTHDALCTLRADLQTRITQSHTFLEEHPEGLPKLGFSAAQIQQQIDNQQRTVDALAPLGCN